jgi:DNA polymerase theta
MSYWDLPPFVVERYKRKGVTSMFEWQAKCLEIGRVLEGESDHCKSLF